MQLRLPPPPIRYDPSHATAVQRELERNFPQLAVLGQGANFSDTRVTNLTVDGNAVVGVNLNVGDTLTVGAKIVVPAGAFVINATINTGTAFEQVASTQAAGKVWAWPAAGGAAAPSPRLLVESDLPGTIWRVSLASSTVSTNGNNAAEVLFAPNLVIAANAPKVGTCYRITARGTHSRSIAAANITIKVRGNAVVLGSTGAVAVGGVANAEWEVQFTLIVTAIGAGGAMEGQGFATLGIPTPDATIYGMANTAPVAIATNAAITLQLSTQWSAAAAASTISLRQLIIETMPG